MKVMDRSNRIRIDTASMTIMASPQAIYEAFLDPKAIATWRPPQGMQCHIYTFEPYERGMFRMSFEYLDISQATVGKTSTTADIFRGRFLKLIPFERIVELIEFESDDPAFAGTMILTTNLVPISNGTQVTIVAENIPCGIKAEDHKKGIASTLQNLAEFIEQRMNAC